MVQICFEKISIQSPSNKSTSNIFSIRETMGIVFMEVKGYSVQ